MKEKDIHLGCNLNVKVNKKLTKSYWHTNTLKHSPTHTTNKKKQNNNKQILIILRSKKIIMLQHKYIYKLLKCNVELNELELKTHTQFNVVEWWYKENYITI